MPKITKRVVDQLAPDADRDRFVWDSEIRGFGIRIKQKSGTSTYLINYRTPEGRQRRLAFAKTGTLTPEEARKLGRSYLAAIANGADPSSERHQARGTMTVGELCDQYMEAAMAGLVITRFGQPKRTTTIEIDKGRVARHIKPCIGQVAVTKLTRADLQRMSDRITQGKTSGHFKTKARGQAVVTGGAGTAARVIEFFGGIWTWAEGQGFVSGANPARGVRRAARGTKEKILSPHELASLGRVLDENKGAQPGATAAVRLLACTGMRHGEACSLRWQEIDFAGAALRLESTKTGRSMRPLGSMAVKLLLALADQRETAWVFPNRKGDGPADLKKRIAVLFDAADLPDARSQVLRRTFASVAANEGYGDSTVGDMIGHARRGVTARHYIRRPDAVLLAAADRVSERIAAGLNGEWQEGDIVQFPCQGLREAIAAPPQLEQAVA